MTARFAILLIVLVLAPLPPAGAAEPPAGPVLEVTFDEREAIPGQTLNLRMTVLVPTFLPRPPAWPNIEAPNLLVRLPEGATSPTSRRIGGETWSGVSRNYRISPMVPGKFVIPPQEIAVTFADPQTSRPIEATLETEPLAFAGVIPEAAAELDPFIAAVALDLTQTIDGDPAAMTPGDAVTRTVTATIRGTSPMFLPALLPETAVDGVAAYPDAPALDETSQRGTLNGTRTEKVTLVAEGGGSGTAPPVALRWYNLDSGTVETAAVEGFDISVDGPPARASAPRNWPVIAATALAGLAALVLGLWLMRRIAPPLNRWLRARRADWQASETRAYAHLRRVVARRDHAALGPALDAWAAAVDGPDPRRYAGIVRALSGIGAGRYGRTEAGADVSAWHALGAALAQARRMVRARTRASGAGLPPLNPGR